MPSKFAPARGSAVIRSVARGPVGPGAGIFEPLGEVDSVPQKSDSFTFALTDKGAMVESTKGTSMTGTIPPNSSVAFPIKTRIDLCQYGVGQFSIAAGAGVTVRSADGNLKLRTQYSGGSLYKRATNEWVLIGDLTA